MDRDTKRLVHIDTLLTADSVEWCPSDGLTQLLAVGTYQLDEKAGIRHGSLSLFTYNASNSTLTGIAQDRTCNLKNGILDMKWHTSGDRTYLGLANSNGVLSVIDVGFSSSSMSVNGLDVVGSIEVASNDAQLGLCLSLDWSKTSESGNVVGVSDSLGQVSLVELAESSPRLLRQWKAHSYEAWIVALGIDQSTVYSGGDDCRLCVWDTRLGNGKPSLVSKRHTMGVCSLQVHPVDNHLLASGSYDETLLLWDTRNMSKPLKDAQLGGGIWRVKWNHKHPDLLATACMHNGFQLVNCHIQTSQSIEVIFSYDKHDSLAYGIDWCPLNGSVLQTNDKDCGRHNETVTLASCSFYDHSMHIWTANI